MIITFLYFAAAAMWTKRIYFVPVTMLQWHNNFESLKSAFVGENVYSTENESKEQRWTTLCINLSASVLYLSMNFLS